MNSREPDYHRRSTARGELEELANGPQCSDRDGTDTAGMPTPAWRLVVFNFGGWPQKPVTP